MSATATSPQVEYEHRGYLCVIENNRSVIYDEDRDEVDVFWRAISSGEFHCFITGLTLGMKRGEERGQTSKAFEIRKALGL